MRKKLLHEAAELFVLNDLGTGDAELSQRWKQWCAEPANRAEYVSLLQLAQDLGELPPPTEPTQEELLKDFAAGDAGISRTT